MDKNVVYQDRYFRVQVPVCICNTREDGGHLVLHPERIVSDRNELTPEEAVDFMRVSMIVGRAMYDVLGIERMNYEDLGNWSVGMPEPPVMHLHFMGRNKVQRYQVRGQHLNLVWPKGHTIYKDGTLKPLNEEEIVALRERIAELAEEEKYKQMACWAKVEVDA